MFHFICKSFPRLRHSVSRPSQAHKLCFLQLSSLPVEAVEPILDNPNEESFAAKYFMNKCGFPLEKAVSASNYVFFKNTDKPDAVISFLKSVGFTETQVLELLRKCPRVATGDPEKIFRPKIEFLLSKGLLKTEIPDLLLVEPNLIMRSLEGHLRPSYDFLRDLFSSDETALKVIKRCPLILPRLQHLVVPNIEILREAGVPGRWIAYSLKNKPTTFANCSSKFKESVEEIKKMGFSPTSSRFFLGVLVMASLSEKTWKKKIDVYRKWDCSEAEVLAAFKNEPGCMSISEDKIEGVMSYFVNEMGWKPQMLLQKPQIFATSLNKRIIPRCSVYQVLQSKGLGKVNTSVYSVLKYTDDMFLKKFVYCHKEEARELLRLYEKKLKS